MEHVGQAFVRIGRVQRHVARARLENRQQPGNHFQAAFGADRHTIIHTDAIGDQAMGNAVGQAVQLAVAQGLPFVRHRNGVRLAQRLGLEQRMHGGRGRVLGVEGVEVAQQVLPFGIGQQRQAVQGLLRLVLERVGNGFQHAVHVTAHALRVDTRHCLHAQAKGVAEVVHRQHQREIGAFFTAEHFHARPLQGFARIFGRLRADSRVPVVEQGAEQRCRRGHTAATLGQGQRRMFVAEQGSQARVGGFQRVFHALTARLDAQRQGVDEHAKGAVGVFATAQAAHQYRAEHHVAATGQVPHHLAPGQMMQAGVTDPQAPCLGAQALAQLRGHRQVGLLDTLAIALHILKPERQARFIDVAEHLAEKRFMGGLADAQPGLRHIITVGHRRRQLVSTPLQAGFDFRAKQRQRGGIVDQVVELQHRDTALTARFLGEMQRHHGRAGQVHACVTRVEALGELRGQIFGRRRQLHLLHRQAGFTPDHLHRLVQALPGDRRAQYVVTGDHLLQGFDEIHKAFAALHAQQRLQQIGVALGAGLMVEQNAFLQRHQCVDVLHVGHAAGNAGDQGVDLRLGQPDQRQHVRGDALAVARNGIDGHLHLVPVASGRRQCDQGRLTEQHAHIGVKADLAHALDQLHRQQRVAAQLKELVVAAHLLDSEQLAPKPRQGSFQRALWGLIFTPRKRFGIRCRQRPAIQLAVGGQREAVQRYEGVGHHVIGQGHQQLRAQRGG